jgi:hypothetical protein
VTLEEQLTEARETIRRLNRRCQLAEAALNTKVEKFEQRSCEGLRHYYYALGVDFRNAMEQGKRSFSVDFAPFARLVAADGCEYDLGRGRCTMHDSPWIRIELRQAADAVDPVDGIVAPGPRA